MYGGSKSTFQPSAEWGGASAGRLLLRPAKYSRYRWDREPGADPKRDPRHHAAAPGFAYVSGIIDPTTKLRVMFGEFNARVSDPEQSRPDPEPWPKRRRLRHSTPRASPKTSARSVSSRIRALQKQVKLLNFQISDVTRYSNVYFSPDLFGDLRSTVLPRMRGEPAEPTTFRPKAATGCPTFTPCAAAFSSSGERVTANTSERAAGRSEAACRSSDEPSRFSTQSARRRDLSTAPISRTNGKPCPR